MRTRIAGIVVILLAVGAICAAAVLTDSDIHVPPNYTTMPPPAVGGSYVDPVFGTTVTRLTDATVLSEPGIVPEYSQTSVFNADDSYMILYWLSSGGFHLYDAAGNHIQLINALDGLSEPRWSRTNPNYLYYHSGNRIRRLDISTMQDVVVQTFSQYSNINFGGGQGDLSDNNRITVVGNNRYVSIYDLDTQTQYGVLDTNQSPINGKSFDSATVAKDGTKFIVGFNPNGTNRGNGMELFDLNGNFISQLQNATAHYAMGRDANGDAVLYTTNSPTWPQQPVGCDNGVVKIDLVANPTQTCLLVLDWSMEKHLSALGSDGWVYVSTFQDSVQPVPAGPGDENDSTKWHAYTDEVFRVRGDGSVIERIVHHRSYVNTYYKQPHATISMSGSKLVYASDFNQNGQSSLYADSYLIDLGTSGGGGAPPSAPSAPSQLQASAYSDPRVDLTWTDNSDDEDAFELLRKGPGETSFSMLAYLGAGTRSYQDFAVVASQEYCYEVVAHNGNGASQPSNSACATPASLPEPPAAPTNVQTAAAEDPLVDVSWTDNSLDEQEFDVERKGPHDTSYLQVGSVGVDTTRYRDMAVTAGDEFCYRVVSRNGNGSSAPSDVSCATTPQAPPQPSPDTPPAAPEQLAAQLVGGRSVRLTWVDASDNETIFEVHRSVNGGRFRRIAQLDADTVSFQDDRIRRRRQHCYRVLAKNAFGSAVSGQVCIVGGS